MIIQEVRVHLSKNHGAHGHLQFALSLNQNSKCHYDSTWALAPRLTKNILFEQVGRKPLKQ